MKTTKLSLLALGWLMVMGCSAASTGSVNDPEIDTDDPPGTAPSAEEASVEAPAFDQTLDQRRTNAAAHGRSMLDRSSAVEDALRRHQMDPESARRDAMAIKDAKDELEREALLAAFVAKYEPVARELDGILPAAIDSAPQRGAFGDPAVDVPSTDDFQTKAHTRCTSTTDTPPYASSSPPPPSGSTVSGLMSVLATGGFADGGTNTFLVRSQPIAVSAADSTVRVTANVALESGRVEVWSALFGYANAGVSLNLVVKGGGAVICSKELKLADIGVNTGHVNHTIPAGNYAVSCSGPRPRDASLNVVAEVQLGAWNGVGGAAGAHAQARARLTSVAATNCVEPGIFFDAEGLCVKPFTTAVGSPARLVPCDPDMAGKWTFDRSTGLIRNRLSGLCLTVDPTAPSIGNGTAVAMRACVGSSGSLRQRWNMLSDGKLRSRAAETPLPGFCLDGFGGGGLNAHLQMWQCLSPAGKNQRWSFAP